MWWGRGWGRGGGWNVEKVGVIEPTGQSMTIAKKKFPHARNRVQSSAIKITPLLNYALNIICNILINPWRVRVTIFAMET